jgi:hypothetical protein
MKLTTLRFLMISSFRRMQDEQIPNAFFPACVPARVCTFQATRAGPPAMARKAREIRWLMTIKVMELT